MYNDIYSTTLDRTSEKKSLKKPKEEPKYLTRKEAATLIHITLPTLRKWVVNGTIQERRIGSRILYSEDELSQAIKDRRVFKYKRGEA
jgi:excisionase family DNA binding protein